MRPSRALRFGKPPSTLARYHMENTGWTRRRRPPIGSGTKNVNPDVSLDNRPRCNNQGLNPDFPFPLNPLPIRSTPSAHGAHRPSIRMATPNQIRANRANALRSTGPKTAEGKQKASRNSIRHGMLSQTVLLQDESQHRFIDLVASLQAQLHPRSEAEAAIVETMAIARWKQMRVWGVQKAGFDLEMAHLKSSCNLPPARAYMVFKNLADNSRVLDLLHRYETGYDRQFCRAYAFFLKLRDKPESRLEDADFSQLSFSFATETWDPIPGQQPDGPAPDEPPTPAQAIGDQKEVELETPAQVPLKTAPNTPPTPGETIQTTAVAPPKSVLRNGPNFPPQQPRKPAHPQPKSKRR